MSLKSMGAFFIDNQCMMSEGAELHGNLVFSKDENKYPSFIPIGQASVNGFDGVVIVQAGPGAVIVSLIEGVTKSNIDEIRRIMSAKPSQRPATFRQYRIDVMALIQATVLQDAGELGADEASPYRAMDMIAHHGQDEGAIVKAALEQFLKAPEIDERPTDKMFETAEMLLSSFERK